MPRLTSRPRASAFDPKKIGHRQLPDLGVEFLHLLIFNLGYLAAAEFEYAGRTFK